MRANATHCRAAEDLYLIGGSGDDLRFLSPDCLGRMREFCRSQALVRLHKEQFHEYHLQVARDYVTQAGGLRTETGYHHRAGPSRVGGRGANRSCGSDAPPRAGPGSEKDRGFLPSWRAAAGTLRRYLDSSVCIDGRANAAILLRSL